MRSRRVDGFTLLELLVTIAVAAVLLGIAIPSYRGMVQRNSLAAQVNDLVGDLNYARSQAVTRGAPVSLCVSKNQSSCGGSEWTQGWVVYAQDPSNALKAGTDNTLRVHQALSSQITMTGNTNIQSNATFDSNGFAMGSLGSFTIVGDDLTQATCVRISGTGRVRTEQVARTALVGNKCPS